MGAAIAANARVRFYLQGPVLHEERLCTNTVRGSRYGVYDGISLR